MGLSRPISYFPIGLNLPTNFTTALTVRQPNFPPTRRNWLSGPACYIHRNMYFVSNRSWSMLSPGARRKARLAVA